VAARYEAHVVVDSTGKGEPIYEVLLKKGLSITPVVFNNSNKENIIDNLAMRIEQGEARLMDQPVQTSELRAFG
jgi:ribulose 1,5-bisphosphate synthetase/thiazole synthase